jgi:hypothetical protein
LIYCGEVVTETYCPWTVAAPVDRVDNSAGLSTGIAGPIPTDAGLIPGFPRSMKKRTT